MKRRIMACVLGISLLLSCAAPAVAHTWIEQETVLDIPASTFQCGTSIEMQEELQAALIQKKNLEMQQEFGIITFSTMPESPEWMYNLMPSVGEVKMLVIPVAYADRLDYRNSFDKEFWENYLFAPYNPNELISNQSVRGFFYWSSYGKLDITGTIMPIYDAPQNSAYYYTGSSTDQTHHELLIEILNSYVEQGIDLSEFDNDGDGVLDAVVLKSLYPYYVDTTSTFSPQEVGDYTVKTFVHLSISEKIIWRPDSTDEKAENFAAERWCLEHEIGHLMGLPDNYPVYGDENVFDFNLLELMGPGQIDNVYINTYYKFLLGWIEPLVLTETDRVTTITLGQVESPEDSEDIPKAIVLILDSNTFPFTEFYLAEYRGGGFSTTLTKNTFDTTPGILIWHCNTAINQKGFYEEKNRESYLVPVYKSGGSKFTTDDIYISKDRFTSGTTPNSNYYGDVYTGAYLEVKSLSQEQAVVRAGFQAPRFLPAPVIEVSAPSKKAICKGETSTVVITTKVGDELLPLERDSASRLFKFSSTGTVSSAGAMGSALKNPFTITIPGYMYHLAPELGDGTIWVDIPAGAIRYNGKDSNAVTSEEIYIDNTPPEITLKGDDPQKVYQGITYVDPGAIATDNLDPDIESKLQVDTSQVDTSTLGSYTVTYSLTDHAGHTTTAERTVIVEEVPSSHEHSFSIEWSRDGTTHWHECGCGEKSEVAAHTEVPDPAVEATCTTLGKTEGSHCSVCGYVIVTQTDIPMVEHSYPSTWNHDASSHWKECTACHERSAQASHTWDKGVVTTVPTSSKPGIRTYTCTVCGRTRTENIPATGGGSQGGNSGSWSPSPATYAISLPKDIANGKVTVSAKEASKGDQITVTLIPEEGYQVEALTVTDSRKNKVPLTEQKDGRYTFTMPGSKVEIAVTFRAVEKKQEPVPVQLPFTDVSPKSWYYEAVCSVYEKGLMKGTTQTLFSPDQPVSRGMLVTMLYRLEGQPAVTVSTEFSDVSPRRYYAPAVAWAAEKGIVLGYTDGTFRPNGEISRQDMALILYRYGQYKGYDIAPRDDLSSFSDAAAVRSYAKPAMEWAVGAGLLQGISRDSLAPRETTNRAQTAVLFVRLLVQAMEEQE